MEKYRSNLNHRPSPDRGVEIAGQTLALSRSINPRTLPSSVDLRTSTAFDCYDQGNLGSCTANATAGAIQFIQPTIMTSRLYNYYYARARIGTTGSDSGAYVSDAVGVTSSKGVPLESTWSYDISKFKQKPPSVADTDAASRKTLSLQSLANNLTSIKSSIAAGIPVVIGYEVYSSMFSNECLTTGNIPMPGIGESLEGGHCVCLWGYNDSTSKFIVRNSWNTDVGDNGYFYMTYTYATNYAWDPWVILEVGALDPPTLTSSVSTLSIRPVVTNTNFTVTNVDSVTSTIDLSASVSPSGLSLSLAKKSVKLASAANITTSLKISPARKNANKTYVITITATSKFSKLSTTTTITVIIAAVSLSIPPTLKPASGAEVAATSGLSKKLDFILENTDNFFTQIKLDSVLPVGFKGVITPAVVTIPPHSTETVTVTVDIPHDAVDGTYPIILHGKEGTTGAKVSAGTLLTI